MRAKKAFSLSPLLLVLACNLAVTFALFADRPGREIQDAIDALPPDGGTVQLLADTYQVEQAIFLTDNLTLRGAGIGQTVLRLADNAQPVPLEWPGGSGTCLSVLLAWGISPEQNPDQRHDITIEGLTIDGNAEHHNTGDPLAYPNGIMLNGTYNYHIRNVRVTNVSGWAGIYTNMFDYWHHSPSTKQSDVTDCEIDNIQPASNAWGGHGIYITSYGNDNVLIRKCNVRDNAGHGIFFEDQILYATVEFNTVTGNGQAGIGCDLTAKSIIRFNHVASNGAVGIGIGGLQPDFCCENLVYGNEVTGNGGMGIGLYYPGKDMSSQPANSLVFSNTVWNNTGVGIRCDYKDNVIAYNVIFDDQKTKTQTQAIVAAPNNSSFGNEYDRHMGANRLSATVELESEGGTGLHPVRSRYGQVENLSPQPIESNGREY